MQRIPLEIKTTVVYCWFMLNCHMVQNPDQKKEIIQSLLGEDRLWVVNDLKSKHWMWEILHGQGQSVINGGQVLRASEWWSKRLLKIDPAWRIFPVSFGGFLVEKWMEAFFRNEKGERDSAASISPGFLKEGKFSSKDVHFTYQTLEQILPVLGHPYGHDFMERWFQKDPKAKERCYFWFQMGIWLWQKFNEKKLIPETWAKAVLINHPMDQVDRPIVFDLDLDLDDIESELILNLSRLQEVNVIVPDLDFVHEPGSSYYDLLSRCEPKSNLKAKNHKTHVLFRQYPSMLSEVKEAVAQVRKWIEEEEVLPHEVAIVSPVIENYWPTLNEFLTMEGIPANKAVVAPLSQLQVFQSWLSGIRLALDKMERFDGEQWFYGHENRPVLNYREFQSKLKNPYHITDFDRLDENAKKWIPKLQKANSECSFWEFFKWTFYLLPSKERKELSKWFFSAEKTDSSTSKQKVELISDFDDIRSSGETLSLEGWLRVLENYLSQDKIPILPAQPQGVLILSMVEAFEPALKKIFVLGLSESHLLESHNPLLTEMDIESIKTEFGFHLPRADSHRLEKQLLWLRQKQAHEMVFSHGKTDFFGRSQAPSFYWLKGAFEKKSLCLLSPSKTRWDEVMESLPELRMKEAPGFLKTLQVGIQRDKGGKSGNGQMGESEKSINSEFSLSASSIEEYFKCPFRFFASKLLNLRQEPGLDLDLDVMSRGSLIHKICELMVEGKNFSLDKDQIEALVESARENIQMEFYNSYTWDFFKPFYLRFARIFMESEHEWRTKHPLIQTYDVERKIKTKIKITDQDFCFSENGDIPFSGMIDRIDYNGDDQFVVIDYKTGSKNLTQYGSWLKKGHLQLILYSLFLMEGADPKNVVAAFYFMTRSMDRSKGFFMNESTPEFLSFDKPVPRENIEEFFLEAKKQITKILKDMKSGKFQPHPRDIEFCKSCDWSRICRAPHLNH